MFGRETWHLALLLLAGTFTSACGSDAQTTAIVSRWKYQLPRDAAPPGVGPERRVALATKSGAGSILTLDEANGTRLEGPYDAFPSAHAPVFSGTTLVIVSSIGKVVGYSLAGEELWRAPDVALGVTSPVAVAPDGSLRVGSSSGRLVGLGADGSTTFDVSIGGAITSPLAVRADGATAAATDAGRLVVVDATGATALDLAVNAPASGPSFDGSGKIAVGEVDGLRAFDASGAELFRHARAARVVGTRFLDTGELIAWGEDGKVEVLDTSGAVKATFSAGPPIYANVVPVPRGRLAVVDSRGTAYRVTLDGHEEARLDLGGAPEPELALGALGWVLVTVGAEVRALDFSFFTL